MNKPDRHYHDLFTEQLPLALAVMDSQAKPGPAGVKFLADDRCPPDAVLFVPAGAPPNWSTMTDHERREWIIKHSAVISNTLEK